MDYACPNELQDQMTNSSADRGALTMPTKRTARAGSAPSHNVTSAVQRAPHRVGVRPIGAVGLPENLSIIGANDR